MRHRPEFHHIAVSCLLACFAGGVWASERPNILLFTADDLHAESLGAYGGRPADLTPHLDAFATEAMRFHRAHVNAAICAPCRAIIATGRYSHRSGAMGFMKAREDVPDIVTTLQSGGYLAGILGKVGHSTPKNSMKWDYQFDRKELGNGRNPEIYYQRSKTFLERSKRAGKPFYFMVNSHDPHRPYCNPDKLTRGAAMPGGPLSLSANSAAPKRRSTTVRLSAAARTGPAARLTPALHFARICPSARPMSRLCLSIGHSRAKDRLELAHPRGDRGTHIVGHGRFTDLLPFLDKHHAET